MTIFHNYTSTFAPIDYILIGAFAGVALACILELIFSAIDDYKDRKGRH